MKAPDKPSLVHATAKLAQTKSDQSVVLNNTPITERYVMDGGSLMYRVKWRPGMTYKEIATLYINIIRQYRLPNTTVVFNGYANGPSTKNQTQECRHPSKSRVVHITAQSTFYGKQDDFLSNPIKKQSFITYLRSEIIRNGGIAIQSPADADVDITRIAVASAQTASTTLIGEDSDLFVLLLHYTDSTISNELYFRSDKLAMVHVYDIKLLCTILGSVLCRQILFIHAFTGCDTSSRIHGVGKPTALTKLLRIDS